MSSTFSFNPHESENEIAFLKRLFDFAKTQDENCIPAIVEEVDKESGDVTVKPLVNRAMYSEDKIVYEDRPSLKVPVAQMRHGGFFISFPVSVGDTGWLFAGDRDWYTAREKNSAEDAADNEGAQNPDSLGKRQFIYGFFMPESWASPESADDRLTIGTTGKAKAYISVLNDGTVQIVSGEKTATFDGYGMTIDGRVQSTDGERKATMDAADLKESNAKFREIFVVTGKDERKSTEGHAVLNMRKMRVLSDEGCDCGDTVDVVAKDGKDGVSVTNATAGAPVSSDGITTTPVTFTFSNGTTRTVNVIAHNGEDGDDGLYVISATADTSYEQNGYTVTPVTFTLSDSATTVGPVNILAKNGTNATAPVQSVNGTTTRKDDANGNDIIADPSTGAVVLYVNKAKVDLLDEDQTITGAKTFTSPSGVVVKDSADSTGANNITLDAHDETSNILLQLFKRYSEGELYHNYLADVYVSFHTTAEVDPIGGILPCFKLSVNSDMDAKSFQWETNYSYIKIHPSLEPSMILGDSHGTQSVEVRLGYDLPAGAYGRQFATCGWALGKFVQNVKYESNKLQKNKGGSWTDVFETVALSDLINSLDLS